MGIQKLDFFLDFESDKCFDYKIDNVSIWKYIREFVYDKYINKVYNTQNRVPSFSKIKFTFFIVKEIYKLFCPDCKMKPKDILFVSFPRRVKVDGDYQCTQIDPLVAKFSDKSMVLENPFWIEDRSYLVSHFIHKKGKDNVIFTDKIEIIHMLKIPFLTLFRRKKFKERYYKDIISFGNYITENLKIEISNKELFKKVFWYVTFEKNAIEYYRKILNRIKPKCLIEVYTPNHHIAVLNTVAHKLHIPIIDIQHGAIGDYEPIMYSYRYKKSYEHLSDYIFCFGNYWTNKKNYHLDKDHVIPVGVPFLEELAKKAKSNKNSSNTIVIISQARYSKMFFDLAEILQYNFAKLSYIILLKLHPYEYSLYKSGYYRKLEKIGVQVDAGLEKHIYSYFENAFCLIGVNSTVLYEALAFGVPVYIFSNKYGTENLKKLSETISTIHTFFEINVLIDEIRHQKNS